MSVSYSKLSLFFLISLNALGKQPAIRIRIDDFVRSPGVLADYKCPEILQVRDLVGAGLYPIGITVHNVGLQAVAIAGETFRLPSIEVPSIEAALSRERRFTFSLLSDVFLKGVFLTACLRTMDPYGGQSTVINFLTTGSGVAVMIERYLWERWASRRVRIWLTQVSKLQSQGVARAVLPGNKLKVLLLLDKATYYSSFPLVMETYPNGTICSVTHISPLDDGGGIPLRVRLLNTDISETIKQQLSREIDRLIELPGHAQEGPSIRAYVEWMLDLPWNVSAPETTDLVAAKSILDAAHYGLVDVKERILDVLAMRIRKTDASPPIICLVGPPGTGKTSLARSIAACLGRPFERVSMGGVDDEADVRGHRRTYVGAMPGRFMAALKRAQVMNPVILIDEIDKMGTARSDAARNALHELLDPEQNSSFEDHYAGVPFDFSQVLFITTANSLQNIPPALRDRMEIIWVSGYTTQEKIEIALKYIWPRALEKTGLINSGLSLGRSELQFLIEGYTLEPGIRGLDHVINELCMKAGRVLAQESAIGTITQAHIEEYLGYPKVRDEQMWHADEIGKVHGLVATGAGGSVCQVQVALMPGTGRLRVTGMLGEVAQESARIALSFVRAHASEYGIKSERFSTTDIHIHMPAGAEPKDGPSAGITMVTALVSAFTKNPTSGFCAMTGEVDLLGHVLPIGGLKEKLLAAQRRGIKKVLIPRVNQPDIAKDMELFQDLEIMLVDTIDQVLAAALTRPVL